MDNYKKIEADVLNGRYINAKITYKDGSEKTISKDAEITDALSNFAIQEGMWIGDLLNDNTKVVIKKVEDIKSTHKEETIEKKEELKDPEEKPKVSEEKSEISEESAVVDEDSDSKSGKRRIRIRYIAGAAVLALIFFGVGRCSLQKKGYHSEPSTKAKQEDTTTYNDNPVTVNDGFIIHQHAGSANDTFNEGLNNTYSNIDTYVEQVSNIEKQYYTESEINNLINQLNMMTVSGVTELDNRLGGKSMQGNYYGQAYEQFFDEGSYDYIATREFGTIRNNILMNAYKTNYKVSDLKAEVTAYLNYLNKFIYGNIPVSGTHICFDDLSPLAKYIIISLDMAYVQARNANYSFKMDNTKYTRGELMELLQVSLGDTYESLIENSSLKRH